jgi:hypothetical protein
VAGPASRKGWIKIELGKQLFELPGTYHGQIQLVIRPERIRLAQQGEIHQASVICFTAEVQHLVDRGVYLQVELDASFPLIAHATHEELADWALEPGMKIVALIRPANVHVISSVPRC